MRVINQILVTASLVLLLALGLTGGAALAQINTRLTLQNDILRKQNEVKKLELAVKNQQLQNEKLRGDIENMRFNAFIKAYSRSEYLVEIEARP